MERTLVIIKPEAVLRDLIGELISIYEKNGLKINRLYSCVAEEAQLKRHYAEHEGKDFFNPLVAFMGSGPIVIIEVSGENAVERVREINGSTNPANARPCTIRYLYGTTVQQNAVHGSATIEDAERELSIWFPQ